MPIVKPRTVLWTTGILALGLLLFAQREALGELFTAWQTEEYSHGLLIPFVAALLGWNFLSAKRPPLCPSWQGVSFLLFGGVFQLVSTLSAFDAAAEYGIVLEIVGLSLCFLGTAATRALAPALAYLLFAVPLPHLTQAHLSENLQLLSSTLGVRLLDLLGVPVFQEGNVIDLGTYKLQVAEACNGLRYLFPLLSFGYLAALLLQDRLWKRITVFLSAIPISIGLNTLRIAVIGITVDLWGYKMAEGFLHRFEGWVVFFLCILLLLAEVFFLRRVGTSGAFRYDYLSFPRGSLFSESAIKRTPPLAALVLTAVFALFFGGKPMGSFKEIIPQHPPLITFPTSMMDWHGKASSLPQDILQALQFSDYWIADYQRAQENIPVNFYIAYYASQRVGTTTHSPSNCIPGGGWLIDTHDIRTISLSNGSALRLTRLVIRRGQTAELVYYWFDERGRDLAETPEAKWYLLWDSLTMHRSDGALIRLVTPLPQGMDAAKGDERLVDFLNVAYPQIRAFIPGAVYTDTSLTF